MNSSAAVGLGLPDVGGRVVEPEPADRAGEVSGAVLGSQVVPQRDPTDHVRLEATEPIDDRVVDRLQRATLKGRAGPPAALPDSGGCPPGDLRLGPPLQPPTSALHDRDDPARPLRAAATSDPAATVDGGRISRCPARGGSPGGPLKLRSASSPGEAPHPLPHRDLRWASITKFDER
jgi:hypothetical protein